MSEFYKKSFFFLSILIIIFLFIENSLSGMKNSYSLKRSCIERDISNLEVLIFGSSESYYDINPDVFGENSCNMANSNQDLYFDSMILSKYLGYTRKLKLVVIPVSYFSLEYNINNSDEYWRKFFYYKYFGIKSPENNVYDIRNYSLIALYTPSKAREYILSGFKTNLISDVSSSGWLSSTKGGITEGINPIDVAKRHTSYMRDNIFNQNLELLRSMIAALKSKDVHVVLVTLPVSKEYFDNIDSQKYERTYTELLKLEEGGQVTYLNYIQDSRFKTKDFVDQSDHLTGNSAQMFSQLLHADIISKWRY